MTTRRFTPRDSALSRATRAFFAFLFRNALPVDASDDLARLRRREPGADGLGLVLATTYRPSVGIPLHGARRKVAAGDAAKTRSA